MIALSLVPNASSLCRRNRVGAIGVYDDARGILDSLARGSAALGE